ncbi:MAG TPA: glycosyltransferase family 2 protein [Thermoanaerobaculia bacterium]
MQPWSDDSEIFRHRRAPAIRPWERWMLGTLIFLGLQSVVLFGLWWFRLRHVGQPVLFALLSLATWYGIFRMMVGWYNAFHIEQPAEPRPVNVNQPEPVNEPEPETSAHHAPTQIPRYARDDTPPPPPGSFPTVAIFITSSPGEPYEMFVRTLGAARAITYPHTTYLLDDTRDPRFAALAAEMGAVHLEIVDVPGAKAGKINVALENADEELILVLDPDHIPFPNFLDRVVGFFDDPNVGFVQVAQAYHNAGESFVARAAAEQTFAFYGPIMQGMHGTGTAVAIGANCTFRRAALLSIGGHGIGLAEDLVTSIRLHGAGWTSIYVPEVVSRGLVPADLGSFMKQQLKWSRGVHEVLFADYPRLFRKLTPHQRISYFMIGSYYFVGATSFIYFTIPLLYLWFGQNPAAILLSEYVEHALPVGLFGALIYRFMNRFLCDPVREKGWHWRGTLLKVGLWNIHLLGLLLAIARRSVPYVPTEKMRRTAKFWKLARVPVAMIAASLATVLWTVYSRLYRLPEAEVRISTEATAGMLLFLMMNATFMSGRLWAAWRDRERKTEASS